MEEQRNQEARGYYAGTGTGTGSAQQPLPLGDAMHEMLELCRQCVREHPLTSVAVGLLVGLAIARR
ncbi:DUF883 C-terminal domain-containing protein [Aquincola sp. MAHUQ-54]|uniref:DUF883 C-terminal domain-containing protein n=1 Tax=Aquincola agrisoli TaxID=3119538 RepID=A0AAW9Q7H5_9BURK